MERRRPATRHPTYLPTCTCAATCSAVQSVPCHFTQCHRLPCSGRSWPRRELHRKWLKKPVHLICQGPRESEQSGSSNTVSLETGNDFRGDEPSRGKKRQKRITVVSGGRGASH
ncbi:hypothetical protein LZ31DRAFT_233271 [Colletotrichum somersetense]|nr:hypothetical protein LZ31DRAFT_233271 [Colletotrichum somersetense]